MTAEITEDSYSRVQGIPRAVGNQKRCSQKDRELVALKRVQGYGPVVVLTKQDGGVSPRDQVHGLKFPTKFFEQAAAAKAGDGMQPPSAIVTFPYQP